MVDQKAHLLLHGAAQLRLVGSVDRAGLGQAGQRERLLDADAVELDPDVFPRVIHVGVIGVGLPGEDEKPLPLPQMVGRLLAGLVGGRQRAAPGDDVVEQVMAAPKRSEGMSWCAHLATVLVWHQIYIFTSGKR